MVELVVVAPVMDFRQAFEFLSAMPAEFVTFAHYKAATGTHVLIDDLNVMQTFTTLRAKHGFPVRCNMGMRFLFGFDYL